AFINPLTSDQRPILMLQLARMAAEIGNPDIALRILKEVESTAAVVPGSRLVAPLIRHKAGDLEGFQHNIASLEVQAQDFNDVTVRQESNAFLFTIKAITGDTAGARTAAQNVPAPQLMHIITSSTSRL